MSGGGARVPFSSRTPADLLPNALTAAVDRIRAEGRPLCDLTASNPTQVGLVYPEAALARALAGGARDPYRPEPRGLWSARRAVADFLAPRVGSVDPDRVLLTASTSEAYGFLFKLLCEPGDEVLVPRPSYPLFEHLARLDAVRAVSYRLGPAPGFALDPDRIEVEIGPRTRAVVVVSPNNPTGQFATRAALDELSALCRDRGLALISDEVFAEYPAEGAPVSAVPSALGAGGDEGGALRFVLGGLSKACGLPQAKLGWMVLAGPPAARAEAAARLEVLADAYLSVSGPIMAAAPLLFEIGAEIRTAIRARVAEGRRRAAAVVPGDGAARLLPVAAGWTQVVALDRDIDEEALALELCRDAGILVHPGYFFDFDRGAHAVVSLLGPPDELERGLRVLAERARARYSAVGRTP